MAGISRSPAVALSILGILHNESNNLIYLNDIHNRLLRYHHYNQDISDAIIRTYISTYSKD
jgi:hypothetical protein